MIVEGNDEKSKTSGDMKMASKRSESIRRVSGVLDSRLDNYIVAVLLQVFYNLILYYHDLSKYVSIKYPALYPLMCQYNNNTTPPPVSS